MKMKFFGTIIIMAQMMAINPLNEFAFSKKRGARKCPTQYKGVTGLRKTGTTKRPAPQKPKPRGP